MLKKIISLNEPMSRIEYFIFGMVVPIVIIMLSFIDKFFILLFGFIPFIVMLGMIKRARSVGLNWKRVLIYLTITIFLFTLFIKLSTPSYFDCTIKAIFYYVIFVPFQLILFLMPNQNERSIETVSLIQKIFIIIMSYIFFIVVMMILRPFAGCALGSPSSEQITCWRMRDIKTSLLMENLDKEISTDITIKSFNNLLRKEKKEYGLDAWGHKIEFEEFKNGFKLLTVLLDKNESKWVRQVVYNYNIEGDSNGCYIDKGLLERFFCKH